MYRQSFKHKDIIKYLFSGDCVWIKYDLFIMNDNIKLLNAGNSTLEVLDVLGSPQEQQANMATTTSPSVT